MQRLFRSRSPQPPTPSQPEGSGAPSHNSDTLALIIKVLEVAENAVDGLPIKAPKAVISSIRSVLQSVKQSSDNQNALDQLHEQVRILDASVLQPLLGCVEVPQAITPAIDNLRIKVEKAAEKIRKRQSKRRGRVRRTLLADQDANELQGFANEIKAALEVFKTSTDVQRMIHQFENVASQVLKEIPRARTAGYDSERSNAPVRCLEGTRTAILEKIRSWLDRPVSDTVEPIYWISGLAGIGKSTIARTVAEDADRRKLLAASFFFSRQEKELSDARLFIPTIAYQLAQSYPAAKSMIVNVIQKDPDIVKKSFTTQINRLILEPIRKITAPDSNPVLFIADALDECDNSADGAARLFRTVVQCCADVPCIRLLVTSRPEAYIKSILMADRITRIVLHEDIEHSVVSGDIRKYLRVELSRIPRELDFMLPLPWPSEMELATLVDKAGELFIWAATVVRFVGDRRGKSPTLRLNILLSDRTSLNVNTQNPFGALDKLYKAILSQAAEDLETALVQDIKIAIGTIVRLRSEMPVEAIGRFLEDDTVRMALGRIQSIIPIPTNSSHPVQIYHPSFPDFITSLERCDDERFHVNVFDHEKRLALRCLDILDQKLSTGAEKWPKPTENVSALSKEAVLSLIPLEVQYACRFWSAHTTFQSVEHSDEDLVIRLEAFSSTILFQWVVAMSILGGVSDAITATRTVQQWMDNSAPFSQLKERFYDAERMMLAYANIISEYPTQLYYSVLPFLPSNTYLSRQHPGRISILIGQENSWSSLLFKLPGASGLHPGTCFSPDGDTLAVASNGGINIYDASNGLLNGSIAMPRDDEYWHDPLQAMFTADGFKVFVLFGRRRWSEREHLSYGIQNYDLAKQNFQLLFFPEKASIKDSLIRLSGDGSYVVYPAHGLLNTRICIWQINGGDYTSIRVGRGDKVRGLSLTGASSHSVAVAIGDIIIIMDIPSGHIRQTLQHSGVDNVCFSPDGLFIASSSPTGETQLFSTTQGTLLATFEAGMTTLLFSPTNHLYMHSDNVRVYNALGDHNQPETRLIPVPTSTAHILPSPDDSQIVIQTDTSIQVWSPRGLTDTHDSTPHANRVLAIDLCGDASLLTIATKTGIEIWDARIGQRRDVIEIQSAYSNTRLVAFSPRGELIVSSSEDGIVVVDVQAGVLRPTRYPFVKEQGLNTSRNFVARWARISFDSSRIAAVEWNGCIRIWDLSSGTLLHAFDVKDTHPFSFRWSQTDLYFLYEIVGTGYRYLNPETFEEEIVEEPDDRFQEPDHLYHQGNMLRIRSSRQENQRNDPLFLALPPHLNIVRFCWHRDRVCVLSMEGRFLLLEISCLDTYMKEYCHIASEPEDDGADE